MDIPNTIRIGSNDYKVTVSQDNIISDGKQCYGRIDFNYHEILIDNTLQDEQGLMQTFLHEVVHGIVHEFRIDFADDLDEDIVDKIADGLQQIIKDNLKKVLT